MAEAFLTLPPDDRHEALPKNWSEGKQDNKKIQTGLSGFPAPARSSGRAYLMAAREPLLH
ncbi:hypothetical protein [Xanthobacter flavus]|uniref:hypothetical protein n=1 Tax=Xanthobacter flavus TaxID=281 RepID=UPI003729140F